MATTAADAVQAASKRGRRKSRTTGEERERAIMQTAERLLQDRSVADISVDDLARGAGISRSAFYFYFPSKDAVVLTLVDRTAEEAKGLLDEASERLLEDPQAAWREILRSFFETFGAHRAVVRAATYLSATNAEAHALRERIMESWVTNATAKIELVRESGGAPPGPPARDLATALVQMNERALSAIFVGEAPAVAEGRAIEVLSHVWLAAIYGAGRLDRRSP